MKLPELVAPAGNLERLRFALDFGADAVYIGGKSFSLRAGAQNFTFDEMAEGIRYAHLKGRKVYITLNIFARNKDIDSLRSFAKEVANLKPDAFIVSDLGVLEVVREVADKVEIHMSTQANITNYQAVKVLAGLGVKRVVLARELSLEEIAQIKEKVAGVELEVFVHGAMCMAYSGRCLLSLYLTGRNANKGECPQCCRWRYYLVEEKRRGELFPVEQNGRGTYILSSKDLCALPLLPELVKVGVDALKIEGRNKSVYYTAITTGTYRKALNLLQAGEKVFFNELPSLMQELESVSHRTYTAGFLKEGDPLQEWKNPGYVRRYTLLAVCRNKRWLVRNRLQAGDEVELVLPGLKVVKTAVASIWHRDEKVQVAHPNNVVSIEFTPAQKPVEGALLRKKV
jgi:putative protease